MKFRKRYIQVLRVEDLSPGMRRINFYSEALVDFPLSQESAHVKLIFPKPQETRPHLGFRLDMKKWMRSYTIRHFDAQNLCLTIDFAVNKHSGLAADWALNAKVGDTLGMMGPGDVKHKDFEADWHLFIGDESAQPAIAATLEKIADPACGQVLLFPQLDAQLASLLPKKSGFTYHTLAQAGLNDTASFLDRIDWRPGKPAIFIAGGKHLVKQARQALQGHPLFDRKKAYMSVYWG